MIPERQHFGSRLRAERERCGISLDSIAAETKIKKSFLESLERGDFSKWPSGTVFRRAYVRDYAVAVGLSPESVVLDFSRLFPADNDFPFSGENLRVAPPQEKPAENTSPLALTFDTESRHASVVARRARAAAIDAAVVLALGAILAVLTGIAVWTACGTLAFVYYPTTYALWGRGIGVRCLEWIRTRGQALTTGRTVRAVVRRAAPGVEEPVALPLQAAVNRPESFVDPAVLTAARRSQAPHVQQETTTH